MKKKIFLLNFIFFSLAVFGQNKDVPILGETIESPVAFKFAYYLVIGVSALVALYGAINAFSKVQNGNPEGENAIRNWIFTCIGLVIMLLFIKNWFFPDLQL
jgi:hypothetical protein